MAIKKEKMEADERRKQNTGGERKEGNKGKWRRENWGTKGEDKVKKEEEIKTKTSRRRL